MRGLVARCSSVNNDSYFYALFSFCLGWSLEKTTAITFSVQGRQQRFGAASLDGGLVGPNAGGSSRSCPFPDPHGCKSSLDFWRFHRQSFFRPSSGSTVHALIRQTSSFMTTILHAALMVF